MLGRKINLVLISVLLLILASCLAYAVYQVSYTDMRTENFAVFRQGNLKLAINFSLYNADGQTIGQSVVFDLDKAKQRAILNFIKPYVEQIALEYDVNIDPWAGPGPKVSVSPTSLDFGTEETELEFTISNNGAVSIDWIATPGHVSISCEPSSGSLDGGAPISVAVTWDRTGLPSGPYIKIIAVTSNSESVNVTVNGEVP